MHHYVRGDYLENLIQNDELQIYRGKDFVVSKGITIHQPILDEICDFGEDKYWNFVYSFTSVPADLKWQLWDSGVDYTELSDFELFYQMLYRIFPVTTTSIIFGDLDFQKFGVYEFKQNDIPEIVLYDKENDIMINEYIYTIMIDVLRKMHGFERNSKMPANNTTKMILIDDARDEYNLAKTKEHHSRLKNLISAMTNSEGFKYSHSEVWDMKINAFMDSVQRITKIKNADLLLQSGYSGYGISLKDVDKKQLDWIGELN